MDPRFKHLIALTRGHTIDVGGIRFVPTRSGRIAIHTPGQFLPVTTDLFDAAMRAGQMAMALIAFK